MHLTIIKIIIIGLIASISSFSNAGLINFDHVDSYVDSGRIAKIDDVNFSYNVKTNPDAFYHVTTGNSHAYNWYGESGMFITFDNAVNFNSIDVGYSCCFTPTKLTINLYDNSDNLLTFQTFTWADTWSTYTFNQLNVSKVEFTFTGGHNDPYGYGDGRLHAWYGIDNIAYSPNRSIPPSTVPEPTTISILIIGIFSIVSRKFYRK